MGRKNMILEYNEKESRWHYNMVYNNRPFDTPGFGDWAPVAYTDEGKARVFTYIMECKMFERERNGEPHYSLEEVKTAWKMFCFVYNNIIKNINVTPEMRQEVKTYFDGGKNLALLGHKSFSDIKEDENLGIASEYNPLRYLEANY